MNCLKPLKEFETTPVEKDAVAIFGGTFDPIHQGHLDVLRSLLAVFPTVIIAPTTSNPWKKQAPTDISHRAEMIRLVCKAEGLSLSEGFQGSGLLLDTQGYVYVADYVRSLQASLDVPLYWAVGEDIADSVSGWKDWQSLGITAVVHPVNISIHASDIRQKQQKAHPAIIEYCQKNVLY